MVKFYARYVDDTLVMIKEDKVESVLQQFNSFDRNLKFTVDTFEDGHVHFLDLTIDTNTGDIDVYSKPTNTGQYSHYNSFSPWNYKVAWARALFNRAKRICSTSALFRAQKIKIGKILSWNGFPAFCRKKLLRGFAEDWEKKNSSNPSQSSELENDDNEILTFTLKIPFVGNAGDKLVKTLKRKIHQNLSEKVKLRVLFTTNKIAKFCNVKDKIPDAQKNGIIYRIKCPGCGDEYVGKTECCFEKRLEEHAKLSHQPMNQHFSNCSDFKHILGIHHLPDATTETATGTKGNPTLDFYFEAVKNSSEILAMSNDWLNLAYLEPLMAKKYNAKINHGEKQMRTLNLF